MLVKGHLSDPRPSPLPPYFVMISGTLYKIIRYRSPNNTLIESKYSWTCIVYFN